MTFRVLITATLCLAFAALADPAIEDIALEKVEAALKQSVVPHPRLFLTDAQLPAVRKKIDEDPALKALYEAVLKEAQETLDEAPVERVMTGRRLLGVSRECLDRVLVLSTAYRFTREARYIKRAEKEMLAAAAFADWNPSHFLDVGEMTTALAIGYDWLYHDLPEDSRRTIAEAILAKGIEPARNNKHWWLRGSNNWNPVCNGGATLGVLALLEDEPELALEIVHRAVNSVQLAMDECEPDGAYPEGPTYWVYGTSFNVLLLEGLESALGTDFGLSEKKGFARSAEYYLHMSGPSGLHFNYPDCGSRGTLNPTVFWFARRYNTPSLLWSQEKLLKEAMGDAPSRLTKNRLVPLVLIWASGRSEMPKDLSWMGRGANPVAAFRSSWTDPEASYLAIKGGSPSTNHAHMDIGSFVMESQGIRWAIDLGPESYHKIESLGMRLWGRSQDAERWTIFRYSNYSHNTLVVNGQLQRVDGMANIIRYSDAKPFQHAVIDMTSVYGGLLAKAIRGAALLPEGQVLIQDEWEAGEEPAAVRWAMATEAQVDIQSERRALLTQGGKTLIFELLGEPNVRLETFSTQAPASYDEPNPGTRMVGFTLRLEPKAAARCAILMTPGQSKKARHTIPLTPLEAWAGALD